MDTDLASPGLAKSAAHYDRGETVSAQGDTCNHVLYVRAGGVKLSVRSTSNRPRGG